MKQKLVTDNYTESSAGGILLKAKVERGLIKPKVRWVLFKKK